MASYSCPPVCIHLFSFLFFLFSVLMKVFIVFSLILPTVKYVLCFFLNFLFSALCVHVHEWIVSFKGYLVSYHGSYHLRPFVFSFFLDWLRSAGPSYPNEPVCFFKHFLGNWSVYIMLLQMNDSICLYSWLIIMFKAWWLEILVLLSCHIFLLLSTQFLENVLGL